MTAGREQTRQADRWGLPASRRWRGVTSGTVTPIAPVAKPAVQYNHLYIINEQENKMDASDVMLLIMMTVMLIWLAWEMRGKR